MLGRKVRFGPVFPCKSETYNVPLVWDYLYHSLQTPPRENTKTALDTVLLPGYNISNFIGQFVTILSVNKTRDF